MQPLNGTYPCPHHRGGTHRKEALGCRWASVVRPIWAPTWSSYFGNAFEQTWSLWRLLRHEGLQRLSRDPGLDTRARE